uniref:Uncharacterized protein n=1 Tax=Rhinolophus ferrumequinum TaxID=59479 RepID=A0A671G893_RHIFE
IQNNLLCSLNPVIIWMLSLPLYDLVFRGACCNATCHILAYTAMGQLERILCLQEKGSCIRLV